jgi:hypothetical protein
MKHTLYALYISDINLTVFYKSCHLRIATLEAVTERTLHNRYAMRAFPNLISGDGSVRTRNLLVEAGTGSVTREKHKNER